MKVMKTYSDTEKNIFIQAAKIKIGKEVSFGNNIDVKVHGDFSVGDRSRLGDNILIRGNNICFGSDLYHTKGLRVGGYISPYANLIIGDRCTIHNNIIDIVREVRIGNDVGLSPEVTIYTHGFWKSVLEGYPAKFAGVIIRDGVIIGYRSIILPGVTINQNAVIGAGSIVTKDVEEFSIYAGNPARLIKSICPISTEDKVRKLNEIIEEYKMMANYRGFYPSIVIDYPIVIVNDCCRFNVETLTFDGEENDNTDDFRDYMRRWGLRFYSNRPFKSIWSEE